MLYTRHPLQIQRHIQTESEVMDKAILSNGNQKKPGVAILISDKIDFKIKTVTRDKEGHYIMIKGSILENVPCALEKNVYSAAFEGMLYKYQWFLLD